MDGPADQVHAHAGPDGGDVVGAQDVDDLLQRVQDIPPGDVDLVVVAADVVRRLPGVLQVDGVGGHAHGVGLDGPVQQPGSDGAHQGAVQAAGEEKPHRHVGVQPLLHAQNQLLADVPAHCLQIVGTDLVHPGDVPVADEFAVLVVVPRGEGLDAPGQPQQAPGLAGEEDVPGGAVTVVQGPDADGVPGGHEAVRGLVVEDEGELRV